jgi:hypothetical protein
VGKTKRIFAAGLFSLLLNSKRKRLICPVNGILGLYYQLTSKNIFIRSAAKAPGVYGNKKESGINGR